ncbi:transposase [bacterium]|jgi:putative transposase|nr:transposase [bacterium]MCI0616222.1 transposase [bacterium]
MKRKRFSEEQIIRILNEADQSSRSVIEICRDNGITDQTYYRWKRKYSGMNVPELQELRQITLENSRLKKIVAERDLEIEALKEVLKKKW